MSEKREKEGQPETEKEQYVVAFRAYISRIAKQLHPELALSSSAKQLIANLLGQTIEKLGRSISVLQELKPRETVSQREVQAGFRLFMPGELAKKATGRAAHALAVYNASKTGQSGPRTKAARAQLVFPPGRCERLLMRLLPQSRKGGGMGVYLAAVLETVAESILEMSATEAREHKKKTISPRMVGLGILSDEELDYLYKNVTTGGGVYPHIHKRLLGKKKSAAEN